MNIEQQVADAQALIKLHIDELARHHSKCIESGFLVAMAIADRRHRSVAELYEPWAWGSGIAAFSDLSRLQHWKSETVMASVFAATEIRAEGSLLYRSDPLYINVPEILAIWLRSTTLYRAARRIWVGERG